MDALHAVNTAPAAGRDRLARRFASGAVVLVGAWLASCGGELASLDVLGDYSQDLTFYAGTGLAVSPDGAQIRPGEDAAALVTVNFKGTQAPVVTAVAPLDPGVTVELTPLAPADPLRACAPGEVPAADIADSHCPQYQLVVRTQTTATSLSRITVSAQWSGQLGVIERVGYFNAGFVAAPPAPDYQLEASGAGSPNVYAVQGFVPVTVARVGGFADAVTLGFEGLGSGITGSFAVNPAAAGTSNVQLQLDLPARYAAGGMVPLRVRGSGGGLDRSKDFVQRIEPLFTVALTPPSGVLASNAPIDIEIALNFDPYSPFGLTGLGRIDLSLPNLPPGVTATFLPDAQPRSSGEATLRRTLRLSSDGSVGLSGALEIRATASGQFADLAGVRPFIETLLPLEVTPGQLWEYVNSGASYAPVGVQTLGIGLQGNDQPAIAWLERTGAVRKAYLKRFDGAVWNPSPATGFAGGLAAPIEEIGEAAFALTRGDVAKVAFTYAVGSHEGARLSIGSAGPTWTQSLEFVAATAQQRARSPRIATGAGDVLALSYLVDDEAAGSSALFVRRGIGAASPTALDGPQPGGALNGDASARVLAGTPALALRADGHPVAAWIEQPADLSQPAAILLRMHGAAGWSGAFVAPSVRPLVAAPLQMVVEPAGTVVVAWLEDSPARLLLARLDPASGSWTALSNTGNADGSLNVGSAEPARDTSLALDSSGRLVVAWTEGGLRPKLWVKRQEATTLWGLLGASVDGSDAAIAAPRLLSDSNGRLYVAYTRHLIGDLGSPTADIFVARWRFP